MMALLRFLLEYHRSDAATVSTVHQHGKLAVQDEPAAVTACHALVPDMELYECRNREPIKSG